MNTNTMNTNKKKPKLEVKIVSLLNREVGVN